MIIYAQDLVKKFKNFEAVNRLNLEIKKGECFGLLGPNGAGKSTFIGMTYGSSLRTSGVLKVFDLDPSIDSKKIKKRLGVVTQENALDEGLSVWENMMIYCSFIGLEASKRAERINELLDYMNLSHKKFATINSLSGGMKRRLVFVRALLGRPELLILDEPTTGLDPAVRQLLWGKVKELHKEGTTILLTTHYMHEAEVLCDRLVVLNHGNVVGEGAPAELIEKHAPGYVAFFSKEDKNKIVELSKNYHWAKYSEDNSNVCLSSESLEALTNFCTEKQLRPLQIRPKNLEDVFLKLTGEELSVDA